ncbi:hypothetical protein, partial [Propionibacterium acidifaciens]|uniref:hypothetical protein n=1 Tax=Propionibacterium acidifaciens TaxID=556499 RepID=UPI00360FA6B9
MAAMTTPAIRLAKVRPHPKRCSTMPVTTDVMAHVGPVMRAYGSGGRHDAGDGGRDGAAETGGRTDDETHRRTGLPEAESRTQETEVHEDGADDVRHLGGVTQDRDGIAAHSAVVVHVERRGHAVRDDPVVDPDLVPPRPEDRLGD